VTIDAIQGLISGSIGGGAVLAILFLLFLSGRIFSKVTIDRERKLAKATLDRETARAERAEARADKQEERASRLEIALVESNRAVTVASDRADASVRATELLANALSPGTATRRGGGRAG
jgi:hypothetical protein